MTNSDEFEFSIKLHLGESGFRVVKNGKELDLIILGSRKITAKLDDDDWAIFWKELASIGVWKYEKEYVQKAWVQDGKYWQLNAKHDGKEMMSGGSNAYPGVKGTG